MKKVIHYLSASILLAACQPNISLVRPSSLPGPSPLQRGSASPTSVTSQVTPNPAQQFPQASDKYSASSNPSISLVGLKAYFSFDGNAVSQDGKHDGIVIDDTSFKEGIKGQSVYFPYAPIDGVGISFIKDHLPVPLDKSFTISVWLKPAPDPHRTTKNSMPILCTTGSDVARFGLFWTPGGTDIFMNKGETDELWLHRENRPRPELQDNVWYQTTVSYDGQQLRIYLNGVLELIKPYTNALPDHGFIGEIGRCAAVIEDHDPSRFFTYEGYIDELRIYSRVLTDAEVQALYQFDKGGSP